MSFWLNPLRAETNEASGRQGGFVRWTLIGAHGEVRGGLTFWSCISMSVTGGHDQTEADWPHRRCALWGPFRVTVVRWFMIYFPINPSLPRALDPPADKCQGLPSQYTLSPSPTVEGSPALLFLSNPNWIGVVNFSLFGHLYCMSANWNKGKNGGQSKNLWMTELLDGRTGLAGCTHLGLQADGVGWGLCNTGLSHMASNHTKPLGNPMLTSNWVHMRPQGKCVCPVIPGQMFGVFFPVFLLWALAANQRQSSLWSVQSKQQS